MRLLFSVVSAIVFFRKQTAKISRFRPVVAQAPPSRFVLENGQEKEGELCAQLALFSGGKQNGRFDSEGVLKLQRF